MNLRSNLCVELILAVLVVTLDNGSCSRYSDLSERCSYQDSSSAGYLWLTSYIHEGKSRLAREKFKVSLPGFPNLESYAGYFVIGSQVFAFLWYFPAQVDPDKAPVVLLFEDPFSVTFPSVSSKQKGPSSNENVDRSKMRHISWNKNKQHIIYIDSLANRSWSYSQPRGMDQQNISDILHMALLQFFEMFPELRNNDFFVAGEGWASQYVIKISSLIHSRNENAMQDKKINLKGMMVGSGLIAQESQIHFGEFLYETGLIDAKGKDKFLEEEKEALNLLSKHQSDKARDVLNNLIFDTLTQFNKLTGYKGFPHSILEDGAYTENTDYVEWIQSDSIRRALCVAEVKYSPVYREIHGVEKWNVVSSQLSTLADLSEHYRVLIYSGNFDVLAPYPVVENMIDNLLRSSSADKIKRAERQEWVVGGELAGYIRKGGTLTQVLIRNAGLFPTQDQPKSIIELTELFTQGLL